MSKYDQLLVQSYRYWDLYLHKEQRYIGRSYAWIRRDTPMLDLLTLTEAEHDELFKAVIPDWKSVVDSLWWPDLYNYAWLGNHLKEHRGHGHMHLIPRYTSFRRQHNIRFVDEHWGASYKPYNHFKISDALLHSIRDDMRSQMSIRTSRNMMTNPA